MVTKESERAEETSDIQNISNQLSSFLSPANLKPMLICLVLQFVQQWCGVHVIMFKTVNVFKTFETSIDHNLCTIIVGVVAFFTTFRQYIECLGKYFIVILLFSVSDADREGGQEALAGGLGPPGQPLHGRPRHLPQPPGLGPPRPQVAASPPHRHHIRGLLSGSGHHTSQPYRGNSPSKVCDEKFIQS